MRSTTVRSALAVLAATTVTVGLAACGGGGGSGGSGGGTNGAGKTLDVYIGANTQFPKEFAAWQQDIANQFKTQTGATVKWETFASANDEVTKIETSAVSGNGPDIYGVGTTMTPTAYATGAFVKLDDAEWQKVGGKDKFLPATLGISGPDPNNQIGIPWATPPVRHGLQQGPAQGRRDHEAGDHLGRARPAGQEDDQRRPVRDGRRLQGQLRPVEVRVADVHPGRQPARRRQDREDQRPDRQEGLPDVLRLADHGQRGEPGRRRMEQHPGPGGVRQGQDRLLPPHDADQRPDAGREPAQGQVGLRAAPDRAAGRDVAARRTRRRPPASSPGTTSWSPTTPRTRTWRSRSST